MFGGNPHDHVQRGVAEKLTEKFETYPELAADADAFFARRSHGEMIRHVFNDVSMPLWNKFTAEVPEYNTSGEIPTIAENIGFFEEVAAELAPRGPLTLIEQGTGAAYAITNKTLPTVAALNPARYVAMDIVPTSAYEAMFMVKEAHPAIATDVRFIDFNTDDFNLFSPTPTERAIQALAHHSTDPYLSALARRPSWQEGSPQVFIQYGNTLSNIGGPHDRLPFERVAAAIHNTRRQMNPGDYMFLGLNQRQEREIAFSHPLFHAFHAQFPHFLRDYLPRGANMNPAHFDFFERWVPETSVHVCGYTANSAGHVKPLRQERPYRSGDAFMSCNSWRFSQTFMNAVYAHEDLELRRVLTDGRNGITIQALRAPLKSSIRKLSPA